MKPTEIDWNAFEAAVKEVSARCLGYLDKNVPDGQVYGFGIEGDVEHGLVYVSANTVSARSADTEWWLPDWKLTYINERLADDSCDNLFESFSDPIDEVVSTDGSFDELCRLFRLACLRALRAISSIIEDFSFPRSPDFSLVYMDEIGAFYCGSEAIREGISALETPQR